MLRQTLQRFTGRPLFFNSSLFTGSTLFSWVFFTLVFLILALLLPIKNALANPILAPGAELKKLYSDGQFTEGVAVADDGRVFFADIRPTAKAGDKLGRSLIYDPETGQTDVFLSPNGQVNGMKFNRNNELLMVSRAGYGSRSLVKLDLQSQDAYLLAAGFNDKPFNGLNDLAIAQDGTIFVTDPRYLGSEALGQPVYGVYAIDTELNVTLVTPDVRKPNGIALSPDGKTLYIAEHYISSDNLLQPAADQPLVYGPMRVLAFELSGKQITDEPRVIADYGKEDGPDGMITDTQGNLYVAARAAPDWGIHIFNPQGEKIAQIATPEKPTNVAFGRNASANTLYITAGGSLYGIETLAQGWR